MVLDCNLKVFVYFNLILRLRILLKTRKTEGRWGQIDVLYTVYKYVFLLAPSWRAVITLLFNEWNWISKVWWMPPIWVHSSQGHVFNLMPFYDKAILRWDLGKRSGWVTSNAAANIVPDWRASTKATNLLTVRTEDWVQNNTRCPFSTLALMNMNYLAFPSAQNIGRSWCKYSNSVVVTSSILW